MPMAASPSNPKPAGDDRNLVPVDENYQALTLEDKLHRFWQRNRNLVLALCGAVLLGLLAKGGWEYFERQKEADVEAAFAGATTPDQLRAFAAAHADHALAGVAQLKLADTAFAAGQTAEALAGYEKAVGVLKDRILLARARLGRAMAQVVSGKAAEGQAELKQLSADGSQAKAVRAEATYRLASLAADAGNAADAQKYSDQVLALDPAGVW